MEAFSYSVDNARITSMVLEQILYSDEFSDVEILAGEPPERIHAHRQILAASSDVFKHMLYGPFAEAQRREVPIPNIQPRVLKALLQFVYTGKVQIDTDIVVPLIQAADQYNVKGAKEEFGKAAEAFMVKADTSSASISQVLRLLCDSHAASIAEIMQMSLNFIDTHTLDVLESDSLLSLPKELMVLVLQRDSLFDGLEEIQLYLAALRWARGGGTLDFTDARQFEVGGLAAEARSDLAEILQWVRLPLIPAEIIVEKIYPAGLFGMEELFRATAYQAAPDCFKEDKSYRYRHRNGSEAPWFWSKENHGPHVLLSNNYKTAHGCHYDWEKCLGNVVWRSGTHSFEVSIELNMLASSNTWQIVVGLAQPTTNLQTYLGNSAREWGMMCLSGQKISKNLVEDYASGSRRGDVIGALVDLNTGRLEFTRNGTPLGVAFENVKGPVSPCISLLKGQKISLLHGKI